MLSNSSWQGHYNSTFVEGAIQAKNTEQYSSTFMESAIKAKNTEQYNSPFMESAIKAINKDFNKNINCKKSLIYGCRTFDPLVAE